MQKSIDEIYSLYKKRTFLTAFTLESIYEIFEIGNEVFMKNNAEEIDKINKRRPSKAPDLFDDEPFSFDRTFEIFKKLEPDFKEVSPELVRRIFEVNSQLAWSEYRKKYIEYILDIYTDHSDDEYINYLAAVVLYDQRKFKEALKCINLAIHANPSSANYTHLKGMCLMQHGELESARTYFYQALFLMELLQDSPPKLKGRQEVYPNYPIEFQTSPDLVRNDLKKLDGVDQLFLNEVVPLLY